MKITDLEKAVELKKNIDNLDNIIKSLEREDKFVIIHSYHKAIEDIGAIGDVSLKVENTFLKVKLINTLKECLLVYKKELDKIIK